MVQRVLVLGGSGFVGRHVLERLVRRGARVTVPTRRLDAARHLWCLPRVDVLRADATDPATLARLLAGHDAVVSLIAVLHGNEQRFEQVHVELPRRIAAACATTGVRRLVHVSALGAAADGPSMYQRSKARGEAVLQQAAGAGTLDPTLLRPSVIFGAEDRFLNLFARLQRLFPVIPLAGADARFQPVWVADVAEAVVRCLHDERTVGQTYEACGPDVWTLRELVRAAGAWAGVAGGRGRPVLALPQPLGQLQAMVMQALPGEPLMSRDNLDSMRVDNVASGSLPGLPALGITPAPLAAVGPLYLGRAGVAARLDAYRRSAGR